MNVLIKVFYISIVGILMLALSGCGCLSGCGSLFSSPPNTVQNLYIELYNEAEILRRRGEYRAAAEKYEQAFKIRPRSTKVIDVRFPTLFKYRIAFCYAKLAEVEGAASVYTKAEAAVMESYQTAILPHYKAQILYLWGYILFKQGRYEEAVAKFEAITPRGIRVTSMWDGLYALGKAYIALGNEAAAQRVLNQLETKIGPFLQNDGWAPTVGDDRLYAIGKAYMELNNKVGARRVFAMLETKIKRIDFDILYALGRTFMELDDETAARRIFAKLEQGIEASLRQGCPRVEDDLYRLGQVYIGLGDDTAAQRVFAKLLEHYPDSSHNAKVEGLLKKQ